MSSLRYCNTLIESIEKAEERNKCAVGYVFRCDDTNKPKEIKADMYFQLWEIDKLNQTLELSEKHSLNYDLAIEIFNTKTDSIEKEISIVSNNSENI